MPTKAKPKELRTRPTRRPLAPAKLDELIAEATVDAYDESEQMTGFYTMLEEGLAMPFETEVLGVKVTVERVDFNDDQRIVAVCAHGALRQRIAILDLPLPAPAPEGSEWIDAYRRWARGR